MYSASSNDNKNDTEETQKSLYQIMQTQLDIGGFNTDFIETYAFHYELVSQNVWEKRVNDKAKLQIKTIFFLPTITDIKEGIKSLNVIAFSNYLKYLQEQTNNELSMLSNANSQERKVVNAFKTLIIFLPSVKMHFVAPIVSSLDPKVKLIFLLDP